MVLIWHAAAGMVIMAFACWMSNIWPGRDVFWRGALARLLWWGMPFGLIVYINDTLLDHAVWMCGAAWLGAWFPRTEMPSIGTMQNIMMKDLAVVVLRSIALLTLPAGVLFISGATWWAMGCAAASAILCIWGGNVIPVRAIGLRNGLETSGVLFGMCCGLWLTVAILAPTPWADTLQ